MFEIYLINNPFKFKQLLSEKKCYKTIFINKKTFNTCFPLYINPCDFSTYPHKLKGYCLVFTEKKVLNITFKDFR